MISCDVYAISPTNASFDATGGFDIVEVTTGTNCPWTATSDADWLAITDGANGTGSGSVTYTVATNTDCSARTGTLTIAGLPLTVIQAGDSTAYTITPDGAAFDADGGGGSVSVSADSTNCSWVAISLDDWITVLPPANGTGDGTVTYTVATNETSTADTGEILIDGKTFTVTQAGGICGFTLDPPSAAYDFGTNYDSVDVQASYSDCPWVVSSSPDWITITGGDSGTGDGTVDYFVAANPSVIPRIGYLTVTDPTSTAQATLTISQDGISVCTYTVSPSSASYNAETNSGNVTVKTGDDCDWTAAANANWLKIVSGGSSSGNDTVSYTVAANTTTNWRNGTLTVAGRTVTVSQAGVSNCICTVTTAPSPSAGGSTSGGGVVGCGSNITVRATANTNYGFLNWKDGGTNVSTSAHYTFKAGGNRSLTANFVTRPTITTTNPLLAGAAGIAYSQTLQATNGTPPYSWSVISNSLPLGLSLDSSSGAISGTPTVATNASFTVQVTDTNQLSATQEFNLTVGVGPLQVAPVPLPGATQNAPYSAPLQAAGGEPPYTWSLAPGSAGLPLGLSLATNGTISGIPSTAGTNYFIIDVTDALNTTTTQLITLTVNASALPPVVSITAPAVLANGQFQFCVSAAVGIDYTVQFSTNLVNWTPILTFTGSGSPMTIVDPNATNLQRYYRVDVGP